MSKLLICALLVFGMSTIAYSETNEETVVDGEIIIEEVENNEEKNDESTENEKGQDEGDTPTPYIGLCPDGTCWPW